jgi:hypothetical protein
MPRLATVPSSQRGKRSKSSSPSLPGGPCDRRGIAWPCAPTALPCSMLLSSRKLL